MRTILVCASSCLLSAAAVANCIPYVQMDYSSVDLSSEGSMIFEEDLENSSYNVGQAFRLLRSRIMQGEADPNPVIHMFLGYRALQDSLYPEAIASLEHAYTILFDSTLCERDLLSFFIASGRLRTYAAVFRTEPLRLSEVNVILALGRVSLSDHKWLMSDAFEVNACIVKNLTAETISNFSPTIAETCS